MKKTFPALLYLIIAALFMLTACGPKAAPTAIPLEPSTATSMPPTATSTSGVEVTMIGKNGETLVSVPEGEFTMGSDNGKLDEKPVHTVYLDAFWIDQTEVTNKQYQACVDAGVCEPPFSTSSDTHPNYYGNPEFENFPVIYVNWDQAKRYCEVWAGGDLPTEAQWEKAASGTDGRTYPWGENIDCDKANYNNSCVGDTTQVGSYESGKSPYGAYDMEGNVMEWVNDWYSEIYYQSSPSSNPLGPDTGTNRVWRGGSWSSSDYIARAAFRNSFDPSSKTYLLGFRCSRGTSP